MCITRKCRICGEPFPLTDGRQTICKKPECQKKKRHQVRKKILICIVCGKEIPVGSCRFHYCSEVCAKKGLVKLQRGYEKKQRKSPEALLNRISRMEIKLDVLKLEYYSRLDKRDG